jgi:hypothetical protein
VLVASTGQPKTPQTLGDRTPAEILNELIVAITRLDGRKNKSPPPGRGSSRPRSTDSLPDMSENLRVILEVGKKERRVVAGAMDWPGLDRWGKNADFAVEKLTSYLPRYAGVAKGAGLTKEFPLHGDVEIVERVTGSGSADYWGIAHVPSEIEREVLVSAELERRLALLRACWSYFDATAERVSAELRPGPRGGGWTRDELIRHVHLNEPEQFTRKSRSAPQAKPCSPPKVVPSIERRRSTGSGPTTPRARRRGAGRSSS